MNERCVIYCRVSSDEQVQGTSLGSQEAACRAFADRSGWAVDRVFVERGESAKSSDRPEFQAMIRYARLKGNGVGRVLVWKLDRFARQNYDFVVFQALLASAGVQIVSATEPSAEGPAGRMMQSVLAVVAQFDNDVRAERTRTSMRTLAEQGYWCHSAPVGYVLAREVGKPVLAPDPVKGPLIARAFAEVASGRLSVSAAAEMLRDAGMTTRAGQRFAVQTLHDMLRAPIYAGIIAGKLSGGRSVQAKFQGLVDLYTWQRVQLVLGGRVPTTAAKQRTSDDFPLRGVIRCWCDRPFTASWSAGRSRRYGYYHCPTGCQGARARVEHVHDQFASLLVDISNTYRPIMAVMREMVVRVQAQRSSAVAAQRAEAVQRLAGLEMKAATLLDKLLDGTVSDEAYKARNEQLQTEIALARVAAHDAEVDRIDTLAAMDLANDMLADLSQIWLRAGAADRARFERALFPHGIRWSQSDGVRTAISSSVFAGLAAVRFDGAEVAPHIGQGSNRLDELLLSIWSVRDLCAA